MTGWSIGETDKREEGNSDWLKDASSLYDKLEGTILPLFYQDRDRFIDVMRNTIAINGSFFSTHRMIQEYVLKVYFGEFIENVR